MFIQISSEILIQKTKIIQIPRFGMISEIYERFIAIPGISESQGTDGWFPEGGQFLKIPKMLTRPQHRPECTFFEENQWNRRRKARGIQKEYQNHKKP